MKLFRQIDFTKKVGARELRGFLFPFFLAAGFQSVYSIVNTAVISRYIGQNAVAVINVCSGCEHLVNSMVPAFISGFGVRLARCIGSENPEDSRQGFWSAVYLTLAAGGLCLLLMPFSESLLRLANVPEALISDAAVYFRIVLSGAPILYLKLILISAIQSMGNSSVPAFLSMAGVAVQTALAVFMTTRLRIGIAAPALATPCNNLWQVLLLIYFLKKFSGGRLLAVSPFQIQRTHYSDTLVNGASKGALFLFLSIGKFYRQNMENSLAVVLLAGDAYCDQYTGLFTELLSVYGTAAVVIVGQNAGRGNDSMIRDYIRGLYLRSLPLCALIAVLSLVFSPFLIRALAGEGASQEALRAGIFQMRVIVVSYPFLTALVLLRYALQCMGDYLAMPLFGLVEMTVVILMASLIPRLGYLSLCLGLSLSRIGAGAAAVFRYRRFMRRRLQELS